VIVCPRVEDINIEWLQYMREIAVKPKQNNTIVMTFENNIILVVGDKTIKEKNTLVCFRTSTNMLEARKEQ